MLYPHQQKIVDMNPARHLLAHSTGTGKTLTAISLADKNCVTCLVIVPKALVKKWERDIVKFRSSHGCNFIVTSKETFKRDLKTIPPFDGVIVDEAHYFAGVKSQLTKALLWYCKTHDIRYRWLLTATPYLSTPMNIFVLAKHLGHEWNWFTFQQEFFDQIRMGHRMVPKVKKNIEGKLALLVKGIGSTVDMEQAVAQTPELGNIPEQIFETEYFDLTASQKKGIKELNDDLFITRFTHTHQIENGFLYGDGYTKDQQFECKKNDRLKEICLKNKKVIIFCRYTHQLHFLKKLFAGFSRSCFTVDGSSTGEERDTIIQKANGAPEAILLVQAQCSAGWEAPTFDTIIFMSLSFSFVDYSQALGRAHRINALKKNKFIHLVSRGVDEAVYNAIMSKRDFSIAIYEKETNTT